MEDAHAKKIVEAINGVSEVLVHIKKELVNIDSSLMQLIQK